MTQEMQDKPMPMEGVKVLELGSLIAGPYASTLLAQFGADVIKIEPPGVGDPLRTWRKLHNGTSLWWYNQSRNKNAQTTTRCHTPLVTIHRPHALPQHECEA